MKNALLKLTAVFALILSVAACSTDEATINNNEAAEEQETLLARGSFWQGQLGVVNPDGSATLTVNPTAVKADLEAQLAAENNATVIRTVGIQYKKNINDNTDGTYALIGSNSSGTSIGILLTVRGSGLYLDGGSGSGSEGAGTSTTCRGCATGCNLSFVRIQGQKVFYCNENGCGEFCTKNESLF